MAGVGLAESTVTLERAASCECTTYIQCNILKGIESRALHKTPLFFSFDNHSGDGKMRDRCIKLFL